MSKLIEEQLANINSVLNSSTTSYYILVVVIFWVLWAFIGSDYVWPIWATIAWGIGILVHFIRVRNNTLQNEI